MPGQRIRVEFTKSEKVRFISHLDVLRYWERVIRRAGLPLSYSQGFTPHPRLTFAAPLPVGFTGSAEVMDFQLDERRDLREMEASLRGEASPEMQAQCLREVPLNALALQAALAWADYDVAIAGVGRGDAEAALTAFVGRDTFEWTEIRKEKQRRYDLRAGVAKATVGRLEGDALLLQLRLAANQEFTVRPEQVLEAVLPEAEPISYERKRLLLRERSPARLAWRRRGRYLDERPQ
jgi:radical SAM-linked protein